MNDVAMSSAVNSCKIFSSDSAQRLRYEFGEIAERTQRSALNKARREEREKTRIETCAENAISLIKKGVSLDIISDALSLSKQELLKLAKKNNITVKE